MRQLESHWVQLLPEIKYPLTLQATQELLLLKKYLFAGQLLHSLGRVPEQVAQELSQFRHADPVITWSAELHATQYPAEF